MPSISVKICGFTEKEALEVAIHAGVRYVGFVFYAPSPRAVSLKDAESLMVNVPEDVAKVGLFVNPSLHELTQALDHLPIDIIQLHGQESADLIQNIKELFGLPVIKAVSVSEVSDLTLAHSYLGVADMMLFDAKPPAGSILTGGNGHPFSWDIMQKWKTRTPWFLSGGLNASNIRLALQQSGAKMVDISSGVEIVRGKKDSAKIQELMQILQNPFSLREC